MFSFITTAHKCNSDCSPFTLFFIRMISYIDSVRWDRGINRSFSLIVSAFFLLFLSVVSLSCPYVFLFQELLSIGAEPRIKLWAKQRLYKQRWYIFLINKVDYDPSWVLASTGTSFCNQTNFSFSKLLKCISTARELKIE